jgi:hypothetical protein
MDAAGEVFWELIGVSLALYADAHFGATISVFMRTRLSIRGFVLSFSRDRLVRDIGKKCHCDRKKTTQPVFRQAGGQLIGA